MKPLRISLVLAGLVGAFGCGGDEPGANGGTSGTGGRGRAGAGGSGGIASGGSGGMSPQACDNNGGVPIANAVVDYDCNQYATIQYGDQHWFRTNLKTTHYRNGDPITTGLNNETWGQTNEAAYAIYEDDPVNDGLYGKLYNWHAVNHPSGLCPEGWHVPSTTDLLNLRMTIGFAQSNGADMKGTQGWESPNTGATNSSMFSARPGGVRFAPMGVYSNKEQRAAFWLSGASANGGGTTFGFHFSMWYLSTELVTGPRGMENGYSVRCVSD